MRTSSPVGDYLRARRALVRPGEAGLVADGSRRVTGLRREEVARLAGISQEYYLRLEQGRDRHPSDQVLDALARALQLDDVARSYLGRLAHPISAGLAPIDGEVTDRLRVLLRQWHHTPAFILDRNLDVVLSNPLADAVGSGTLSPGANRLVEIFSPFQRRNIPDWENRARELVGALRLASHPDDPRLQQIIGGLALSSAEFGRMWAQQDVHLFIEGDCHLKIDPFGLTRFHWRNFAVEGRRDLSLTLLYAPDGSSAAGALAYAAARVSEGSRRRGTEIETIDLERQAPGLSTTTVRS